MNWKDRYNDKEIWIQLSVEVENESNSNFRVESGSNFRFKLYNKNECLLWGTFGKEHGGAWVLNNYYEWDVADMPVQPIHSVTIEKSKEEDYYKFWSRFFAQNLGEKENAFLSKGIWRFTKGITDWKDNIEGSNFVSDTHKAFVNNPRWIDWGLAGNTNDLVALKKKPDVNNGRLKWFRKLVRDKSCPPVLVFFLNCLDSYVILDGHCRLNAFLEEGIAPAIITLHRIREEAVVLNPKVQEQIVRSIEKRSESTSKRNMSVEEVNKLLISAFDNRPYSKSITNSIARMNYNESWTKEVKEKGENLKIQKAVIDAIINRIERA